MIVWPQTAYLSEAHFVLSAHRIVWHRLSIMVASKLPIDEALVVAELNAYGELEQVGAVYVASLTDGAVARRDVGYLVHRVLENALRRDAGVLGERFVCAQSDPTVSLNSLAEEARNFAASVEQEERWRSKERGVKNVGRCVEVS